ncbi:MAG: hypothetical protein ACRCVT_16150 [Leadbetterella sp.]
MKPLFVLLLLLLSTNLFAQKFQEGFDRFSKKKPVYITLNDGSKLEGTMVHLDRKRGNIEKKLK